MQKTRTNQEWLHDLGASGSIQEAAITDLRELLLRAALYFFSRNLEDFSGLDRDEILQRAEDCAQDALLAIMDHLQDFRGDSKFSTWAYKFAINKALLAARRERWNQISINELVSADEGNSLDRFNRFMQDGSHGIDPEQSALQSELQSMIVDVILHDLTGRQRQVLVLMLVHDVPLDEVVRYLGTNRNAVYKMLHEARRKLKSALLAKGFDVAEMMNLFSASR
jgi:RNA polymerase sigma-70 factor (ECF subfamily)